MEQSLTTTVLLTSTLAFLPALGCSESSTGGPDSVPYLRSDSPELQHSWPSALPVYQASHQDELAVVQALGLDSTTREFVDEGLNRVSYVTPTGSVQVFYDDGFDKPYHTLRYLRDLAFQPQSWTGSADLRSKWEAGARLSAEYLAKLTKLTPVVSVGHGSDADYAAALTDGYQFMLAVDHRLVGVDDLEVLVDANGIYAFSTDELAFDATQSGSVDCLTREEVQALLASGGRKPIDPASPLPIFYGFDTDAGKLSPFFLAAGIDDTGSLAILLDRAAMP